MKAIVLCDPTKLPFIVYNGEVIEEIKTRSRLEIDSRIYTSADIRSGEKEFLDVDFIFSTWGMPALNEEEIERYFPSLKCIFYAAGSVQKFARPFFKRGVRIFSAWAANAIPVAEFTAAEIILANKGLFPLSRIMADKNTELADSLKYYYNGNFRQRVGLIGCGMIGSYVAKLLKNYNLEVWAFDPFLPEERAKELGVKLTSLEELFKNCSVVSNHLADNEHTRGMLNYSLFSLMGKNASFINTGRGAQVVEDDLVRILTERPDITAILDVTYPEPPEISHPFYTLKNCVLTPHIAGNIVLNEQIRMIDDLLEEFERYVNGEPVKYEVTENMLDRLA